MNYIRGAVNVISAPYQYYRDLPPINPSTLTGAIDVIVIQRPTVDGGSELVCSPFHVRFGKWQVLRPGEKKVNVSVNGHPIPFSMKVGEAGEAFFVFETEDDVPDDLITSPILQPTRSDDSQIPDIPTDDLGAMLQPVTSDTPLDTDEQQRLDGQAGILLTIDPPVQEYSWDWGAFPQPIEADDGIPSRPGSPLSDEDCPGKGKDPDEDLFFSDGRDHKRCNSEPPEPPRPSRKSTPSSWVRWWRRSKAKDNDTNGTRIGLNGYASSSPVRAALRSPPIPPGQSSPAKNNQDRKFAKTLRLNSDQLKALDLKPGANIITFSLSTTGVIACTARIFVWDSTDLVVVSDIDGTITKSDGLGHVFAMIGRDWTHVGVAKLYTDISRNGYKMMYLTSRAIGQADATRGYLKGIKQNDYQLPEGPVIMSPDGLMVSLHREVIMRTPEVFKMACLRDIQRLFGEASRNPFYAGFGNRITDALSYRSVDVPSARIFTIDSTGEVKMELLELAGYKSSYLHMTDLVDQMFPPIHRKWANEFTDFNYWKTPVQEFALPDLTPPSPALSARSDRSNQSTLARLRNFSLVPSRSTNSQSSILPLPATAGDPGQNLDRRSPQLKQISSFERLGAALVGFGRSPSSTPSGSRRSVSRESRTSSSLTYADSASDDEYGDEGEWDEVAKRRRRVRTRSMTSMPGSLDDIHFGIEIDIDDNIEDGKAYEGEGSGDGEDDGEAEDREEATEEATEEAFDEDFLATTQMKNVPYL